MHLIYAGVIVFILSGLPLLLLGKSLGAVLLVLSGGLFAIVFLIMGATTGLWRLLRHNPRPG